MIKKVSEGIYEKDVVAPSRKEKFTIAQKEAQRARLQAMIDVIDADIAEAKALEDNVE